MVYTIHGADYFSQDNGVDIFYIGTYKSYEEAHSFLKKIIEQELVQHKDRELVELNELKVQIIDKYSDYQATFLISEIKVD